MLNQTQRLYKSKSKIFLIILCIFGLLFSYSCTCRNRVTGVDDGTPPGSDPDTFSISVASGNVLSSIVQSQKTIGDVKIAFVEANNHDYTMDYTVEDATETVEANKIDKTDFTVANNVLTAKESLLTKVRALNTDNGPAEKTITINFTFKANDGNLKNNTQTSSVEVKLTHAKKLENDRDFQSVFNKMVRTLKYELGEISKEKYLEFNFGSGTFKTDTYTINNSTPEANVSDTVYSKDNNNKDVADELRRNGSFFAQQFGIISEATSVSDTGIDTDTYTITYNFTFDDKYEVDTNPKEIKFAFKAAKQ